MTKVKEIVLDGNMYNIMHGVNELAPLLKKILDLDQPEGKYETGRFRDISLNKDASKIILFTRNGGGNREQYQPIMDELAKHPNYLTDYDDDYDSTYAHIEFSVPSEYAEQVKKLAPGAKPKTLKEKSDDVLNKMDKMSKEELEEKFPAVTNVLKDISKTLGEIEKGKK